jgi:hypothetical protein
MEQSCPISRDAEVYLEEALDFIQQHSVRRDEVDWSDLRRRAFLCAKGARTPSDTYQAIRLSLSLLEDRHSFFASPEKVDDLQDTHPEAIYSIQEKSHLIDSDIGYICIPPFHSLSANWASPVRLLRLPII